MGFKLCRSVEVKGKRVRWLNSVGAILGQSGTYTFSSNTDAQTFAEYARRDGSPSLADADLQAAGIPIPSLREEF